MKVFKFGGASVKDAEGVRNLKKVLDKTGEKNLIIVVSAMGKTTNLLEQVVSSYLKNTPELKEHLELFHSYHKTILDELFPNASHPVYGEVRRYHEMLESFLKNNKSARHPFVYDQIVGYGELVSTTIVSHFLLENGVKNTWLDVRKCVSTDANYRDALVDLSLIHI